MISTNVPAGTDDLNGAECWRLLRTAEIGRLAVVLEDGVDLFPVNYVVDRGSVVFRTAAGSKLAGALSGAPVAFEADGYDNGLKKAWSVVLKGQASQLQNMEDMLASQLLPLFPWQAGDKPHFIRVLPDRLTGRRFRPSAEIRRGPALDRDERLNVE